MMLSDVWWLSVWHLSVTYIGPKSRTERSRKTKIGTEVTHVTHDSDTTFKVKRSRSPGRFTHRGLNARGRCSGDHENVLGVGNYVASARQRARRWGAHGGKEGRGISCRHTHHENKKDMVQYSLFVLKVPLNPKQTNKQTNVSTCQVIG